MVVGDGSACSCCVNETWVNSGFIGGSEFWLVVFMNTGGVIVPKGGTKP